MKILSLLSLALLSFVALARADKITDPAVQARVDDALVEIQKWAADPVIVVAVTRANAEPPAEHVAMNQEKWKSLHARDPFVRGFIQNEAGLFLKTKQSGWVSEAFLSDAAGRKIAFLAKTSNWSHVGMSKHDVPMSGKTWQGRIALDESTGLWQLQIAVPVLDAGKPIGSLVVGLSLQVLR